MFIFADNILRTEQSTLLQVEKNIFALAQRQKTDYFRSKPYNFFFRFSVSENEKYELRQDLSRYYYLSIWAMDENKRCRKINFIKYDSTRSQQKRSETPTGLVKRSTDLIFNQLWQYSKVFV